MPSSTRKALIKDVVGKDDFKMEQFLEDLTSYLAGDVAKNHFLIKKTLRLRRQTVFNLNPRIQLENLFS
jgi:hypothetical protein